MNTNMGDVSVESWWCQMSRTWVTQVLDKEGNQIGNADFSPNKQRMKVIHRMVVRDANRYIQGLKTLYPSY